jgi:hypothetical protein
MWILILVFVVALVVWSGALWLLLTIDIFDYSMTAIVGMHLVPPLIVVALWMMIRYWRKRYLAARQQEQEQDRQQALETDHNQQKKAFDAALQQRRVAVECRWAAAGDLTAHAPVMKYAEDTEQTRTYPAAAVMADSWPHDALVEMLKKLYEKAPIAGGLPIAFCGPSNRVNDELVRDLREIHTQAFNIVPIAPALASIFDVFALVIRGKSIHGAMLELFASRPDLPGVVVVAFDTVAQDNEDEEAEWFGIKQPRPKSDIEKWCGKPGRALIVQLITPAVLTTALAKIDTLPDNVALNAMTPHWERQHIPIGMASWLVQWPKAQREAFAALSPVATLHAPSSTALTNSLLSKRSREQAQAMLTEAAIDADLIDPPFVAEGEIPSSAAAMAIENCGWVVHNAGDVTCAGERIALLFYAIVHHGIDIEPVEHANAVVPEFGHCGEASRWLWLTLAIQRAAAMRQHVVLAEFSADVLTVSFVVAAAA